MIDCLKNWLIDWQTDCLLDWLNVWLITVIDLIDLSHLGIFLLPVIKRDLWKNEHKMEFLRNLLIDYETFST